MKITKRLNDFINEVAREATKDKEDSISFPEYVEEYRDQIESDDFSCLVTYANDIGIVIPRALKKVLKD